jgi:hypothetical protein
MRRGLSVVALAVLAGVTGIAAVPGVANAAAGVTLYAAPAGTGDCSSAAEACSLPAAVTEANGDIGDTVVLAGGTYTGVALTLNASMSLIAAPGADPVLDGQGQTASTVPIFVAAGATTISGLTVTYGPYAVGTSFTAQSLTVAGSTLDGNLDGIQSNVPVTVTGTTISANANAMDVNSGSMTVTNSVASDDSCGLGPTSVSGASAAAIGLGHWPPTARPGRRPRRSAPAASPTSWSRSPPDCAWPPTSAGCPARVPGPLTATRAPMSCIRRSRSCRPGRRPGR